MLNNGGTYLRLWLEKRIGIATLCNGSKIEIELKSDKYIISSQEVRFILYHE